MLISLCNCNLYFSHLLSETLLNPSFPIVSGHYPKFQFKPTRRRASICAAAAKEDSQTLPQSAIQRIAEKLRSLGYVEESATDTSDEASIPGPNSPGEIFVPLPNRLPKYRVGHTLDPSWSTPENPVPEPGSGNAIQRFHEVRRRVLEEKEKDRIRKRIEGRHSGPPTLAELKLSSEEIRRLRSLGIRLKKKLKVGKAGITEGIVNGIHERWRRTELVKITCEDICRLNMKRTHELLERKTGGIVIWRSGSSIILYRGSDYKYPYFSTTEEESSNVDEDGESVEVKSDIKKTHPPIIEGVGVPDRVRFQLPGEAQLADEADALLDGLGPRFTDWWGYDPLPVDGDLLPAVVPGYRRPFRLLPYGIKAKLTNDEMTTLRRLGRHLPCHFALGRNRKLQGLAASIVKLWEKCEIAKIAVKRGVQNTNSELMAQELKWLTGGALLSRDREFIVFYRGKDFLPTAVTLAIQERRRNGPETGMGNLPIPNEVEHKHGTKEDAAGERKPSSSEAAMLKTSTKLSMALEKKARAELLLTKLEKAQITQPPEPDKEGITEEERYMLRRLGLRMKAFLLLGRRGVFDGTVENMHLHWKYRELVKVCIGSRSIEEVHGVARTLEAESGGILVAVERVSKGFAIIVYRGKNYKRPASLRPQTLLTKRAAMKRSLEAQRRESLKLHVLKLSKNIDELKLKMVKDEGSQDTKDLKPISDLGFVEQEVDENDQYSDETLSQESDDQSDPESDGESYFGDAANKVEQEINENHFINQTLSHEDPGSDDESYFEDPESDGESYIEVPTNEEIDKNQYIDETLSHEDHKSDDQSYIGDSESDGESYSGDPANEVSKSHGTGATFKDLEDSMHTSKQSMHIVQPNSEIRRKYLFHSTEANTKHRSLPGFLHRNDPTGNPGLQDRTTSAGNQNAELESLVQRATNVKPSTKALQLSNRERLVLRKQALKIRKTPLFSVGKSNVITGLAKAIKAHFEKHPLAIVHIKGRAKGTSAREVIYNLEQATGAVLVSQEPSKVILYRGWGSGTELDPGSGTDTMDRKVKTRPPISHELISAIRLECGLAHGSE